MISSIGSTCNIAIFPSVHAYDMYMVIKFYSTKLLGNLLMHVTVGNESLSWGRG